MDKQVNNAIRGVMQGPQVPPRNQYLSFLVSLHTEELMQKQMGMDQV